MDRRVVSLWLPTFATDRLHRRIVATKATSNRSAGRVEAVENVPLVTVAAMQGGQRVAAADAAARRCGIHPGAALADARAMAPALRTCPADPVAALGSLERLADWCTRYTPWAAVDPQGGMNEGGSAGLWLDITGCAHLFGGEMKLLGDLTDRLQRAGFAVRAAVADTPGAAWAAARLAGGEQVVALPPQGLRQSLAPLPAAGLRLEAATVAELARLGLRRIGDIANLPRAPLAARFGDAVVRRLDQALGIIDEPVSPRQQVPDLRLRLAFAEPIGRREDIAAALDKLLADLCARLERDRQGVRRLTYRLFRADGSTTAADVGTSRPVRDAAHLTRLFIDKLDDMDPGFGVDMVVLSADALDLLVPAQTDLAGESTADGENDMARLVDRLGNRLGTRRVVRLQPRASHLPERASRAVPVMVGKKARQASGPESGPSGPEQPRPVSLLPWPELIDVIAPVPDHPPVLFRWRRRAHRVARAEGPERIGREWWLEDDDPLTTDNDHLRDYYRVEDSDGGRYWVYREGLYRPDRSPKWYLHGFFG